jgi:hypothetical protein
LQKGLAGLREFRDWRAVEIARRLEKKGISGALEGARRFASGGLVSRTHFARYLVKCGHAPTLQQVFKKFLTKGRPGHVPGQWTELAAAVDWITGAGGQAVIAHPARYKLSRMKLVRLCGEFRECGGEALEVISGTHNKDECYRMAKLAVDAELLASAGSDYHGPENPHVQLGRLPPLPPGIRPVWHDWSNMNSKISTTNGLKYQGVDRGTVRLSVLAPGIDTGGESK